MGSANVKHQAPTNGLKLYVRAIIKSFIPKIEISKDKCKSDFVQEVYVPFLPEGTI